MYIVLTPCFFKSRHNTITIDMDVSNTVDSLKAKIQEMKGLAPIDQKLTYFGKQLENGKTLAHYHIHKDSTLELMHNWGSWLFLEKELQNQVKKHILDRKICRKCYSRLPINATNCRKRKCRSNDLRKRHGFRVGWFIYIQNCFNLDCLISKRICY